MLIGFATGFTTVISTFCRKTYSNGSKWWWITLKEISLNFSDELNLKRLVQDSSVTLIVCQVCLSFLKLWAIIFYISDNCSSFESANIWKSTDGWGSIKLIADYDISDTSYNELGLSTSHLNHLALYQISVC